MKPFDSDWQQDLPQQLSLFDQFLQDTAELYDRQQPGQHGLSYNEAELDAFYHGWNAALGCPNTASPVEKSVDK